MDLKVNVVAKGNTLTILDNGTDYLPEDSNLSFNRFKKIHCDSILLIETHKSTDPLDEITISDYTFEDTISVNKDGWVTIWYVVLPNKRWIDLKEKATTGRIQDSDKWYYFIDNNKVYAYYKGDIQEVEDIKIIISDLTPPTTSITTKEYVNISNLYDCYINFCQQLLQDRGFSKCWSKNKVDSELVYKRDLVWMAINVIDYLVDRNNKPNQTLAEAQRIIELIHSCTGVCPEQGNNTKSGYGCGCSQR